MKNDTILQTPVNQTDWAKIRAMPDEEIVYDEDNPIADLSEWTDPIISHSLDDLRAQIAVRRVGRPVSPRPKQSTTLRLSPEVMEAFRATGKGWQTRIDNALKDWLKTHNAAG